MSTALATQAPTQGRALTTWTAEQRALVKSQLLPTGTDDQLALFLAQASHMGLDPFAREICATIRETTEGDRKVKKLVVQVQIDGYRKKAAETGRYVGQVGPYWSDGKEYPVLDADGKPTGRTEFRWLELWPHLDQPPRFAKVGVLRLGMCEPIWGIARWESFVQNRPIWQDGKKVGEEPNSQWQRMGEHMLAKCAEALAIRKAFPAETALPYFPLAAIAAPPPRTIADAAAPRLQPTAADRPDLSNEIPSDAAQQLAGDHAQFEALLKQCFPNGGGWSWVILRVNDHFGATYGAGTKWADVHPHQRGWAADQLLDFGSQA